MKKNLYVKAVTLFSIGIGLIAASPSFATSGACSGHGGVNCSAGADYDGSVICYDGWRDSSVSYYNMVSCSTYGSPSYSSPSYNSPTCPSMSLYDSFSDSCKCMSGYIVGKDYLGNQACVYADTVCHQQIGIMSNYNILNKVCECDYGYVLYNGQCTSHTDKCTDLFGYGAKYNNLSDQCECKTGYSFNGSRCSLDLNTTTYSIPSYSVPAPSVNCALNSTLKADGICYCNDGYQVNSDKSACIAISCPTNSILIGNTCSCLDGFVFKNSACISYGDDCRSSFGVNTYGAKGSNGGSLCYCSSGYQWSLDGKSCIQSPVEAPPVVTSVASSENSVIAPPVQGSFIASKKDPVLIAKMRGLILLQVEAHGEAWYVNPLNSFRYYMPDGSAAYKIMRSLGNGIATNDLNKITEVSSTQDMLATSSACSYNLLANRMKGKILLQVQDHGEAWYVDPRTCKRIYMKNGDAAYQAMRFLGVGIADSNLEKMPTTN